jgi:thioredoxin reductase
MTSDSTIPVAVIGAGPYGLSVAAHLSARRIPFRIFGEPMGSWRHNMPQGMFLKSEGHASSLSDSEAIDTLAHFSARNRIPYRDFGLPVPIDVFIEYGIDFQRRHAPQVEQTAVTGVRRSARGFELTLANGESVYCSQVVVAIGFAPFRHIPDMLSRISPEYLSHSADHHDLSRFAGKSVCVIGAGASATDVAAALDTAVAKTRLVSRSHRLEWVSRRTDAPHFEKLAMLDALGGGRFGQGYAFTQLPHLFRYLPGSTRARIVKTYLGPRGGWPVRDRVEALPNILGTEVLEAHQRDGGVSLILRRHDGHVRTIHADHAIAATGYKIDLRRIGALAPEIRKAVRTLVGAPELSSGFESSVPGLYFVGYAAVNSFGPLMRFVAGSHFAATRVTRAITGALAKPHRAPPMKSPSIPQAAALPAPERE